jgi:predicted aminopeptidase
MCQAARMVLRALTLLLASICLSGCYVLQAATGQLEVMRRSEPISGVLADPATPPATRTGLELVVAAREFAVSSLGLPDSRSYRQYADLGRPYVVWNVVATPEFSVEPLRWCFPVAGCVAYRGYFDEARARSAGLRLWLHGNDVAVGGVGTYSTLGHLPDPVFGAMLRWRETRLVGTIFHELAHEQLYFPGDSAFNEAFASVVAQEGLERWLEAAGRGAELQDFLRDEARELEFVQLLRNARESLARLYRSEISAADMRIEKQRAFGRLKFDYEQVRKRWGGYAGYDAWFARPLNNAHLASVATYHDCVPGLQRLLQAVDHDLPEFYARVEKLRPLSRGERRKQFCVAAPEP